MKILLHALYLTIMVITRFRLQGEISLSDAFKKKFIQISLLAVSRREGVDRSRIKLTYVIDISKGSITEFDKYLLYGYNTTHGEFRRWSKFIKFLKTGNVNIYYHARKGIVDHLINVNGATEINMNERFILFLKYADAKIDIRFRLLPSDLNLNFYIFTIKCIIPSNILTICLECLYLNSYNSFGFYTPNDCALLSENYNKDFDPVNYINSYILNREYGNTSLGALFGVKEFKYNFRNNSFLWSMRNPMVQHRQNVELFDVRYQSFQIMKNNINIKCIIHTEYKQSEEVETILNCTKNSFSVCLLNGKQTCKDPNSEKSNCTIEADRCNPNPCKNSGLCQLNALSHTNQYRIGCNCTSPHYGTLCQYSKSCQNCASGSCDKRNTVCSQCNKGWSGDQCSKVSCLEGYCKNNGNCFIEMGKRKCSCVNGYIGYHCDLNRTETCGNSACEFKNDILYCIKDDKKNIKKTVFLDSKANQTIILSMRKYYIKTFYIILYINIISNIAIIICSVFAHMKKHRITTNFKESGEYILPQKYYFRTSKSNKSKDVWVKNTITLQNEADKKQFY